MLVIIDGTDNEIKVVAKGEDGYLYFDVCPVVKLVNGVEELDREGSDKDFAPKYNTVNPGNSLLAVKNGANTAWSWHLWFYHNEADENNINRPDNPDKLHKYPETGSLVMNRPLGATKTLTDDSQIMQWLSTQTDLNVECWTDGLYYQWGRKDPFALNEDGELNDDYPIAFYNDWSIDKAGTGWTSDKSVNDPCPPGYKVPSKNIWTETDYSGNLGSLMLNAGYDSIYPYNFSELTTASLVPFYFSSYLDNGILQSIAPDNLPDQETTVGIGGLEVVIKYDAEENKKQGELWSTDGHFDYTYSATSIDKKNAEVFVHIDVRGYSFWMPCDPKTNDEGYTVDSINEVLQKYDYKTYLKDNFGLSNFLAGLGDSAIKAVVKYIDFELGVESAINLLLEKKFTPKINNTIPASRGIQVRCVQDKIE